MFDGGCTAPDWRFLPRTGPWRAGGGGATARTVARRGSRRAGACWGSSASRLPRADPRRPTGKRAKKNRKSPWSCSRPSRPRAATPDATVLRWAANVGEELRNASRDVLLRDELQDLYDEASYSYTEYNGTEEALKLAERMSKAVKGVEASVAEFKQDPAGVRPPRRRLLRIGRPATLQGHRHARDRELLLRRRPGPAPGHRVLRSSTSRRSPARTGAPRCRTR